MSDGYSAGIRVHRRSYGSHSRKPGRGQRFAWAAVIPIAVSVLIGCTAIPPPTAIRPTPPPSTTPPRPRASASLAADAPFFPQQLPPDPMAAMEGLIRGELVLEGRCLRLVESGSESYLLLWPSHVRLVTDPRVAVVDGSGNVLVRVGERIAAGGGEPGSLSSDDVTPPPPLPCEGPYWAVGSTLEVAP